MLTLGPLAFLNPWLLVPLVALPALWWWLRLTPPAPRRVSFPAIRLLMNLPAQEETPAHTPWWLLLLRCLILILILSGLAQPVLNPAARLQDSGPLLLVVDDGWAAGSGWIRTQSQADALLTEADRNNRPVRLLFTAPRPDGQPALAGGGIMSAAEARRQLTGHLPSPFPTDRVGARAALAGIGPTDIVYLSDGTGGDGTGDFLKALAALGPTQLHKPAGGRLPLLLLPPETNGDGVSLTIVRAGPLPAGSTRLRAIAADGRLLAREEIRLPADTPRVTHTLRLPAELRNAIVRLDLENESSAGAVVLLDTHWRRRPVGIVAGSGADKPLLGEAFYLERALRPYADIRTGEIETLLERGTSLILLADVGGLSEAQQTRLTEWISQGGILVRFAGPNLAARPDPLLPVPLRTGERKLGGSLSWTEPLSLRDFSPSSPLVGLPVPSDVRVSGQVLAEPGADLTTRTWATLSDGTPLITGQNTGKGWLVLIHTTANTDWSNLALSGVYVGILRRLLELGSGIDPDKTGGPLLPIEIIGGLGQSLSPPATVKPLAPDMEETAKVDPSHPPGFYGSAGRRFALNLTASVRNVMPMPAPPAGITVAAETPEQKTEVALLPWLLGAALLLLALDLLVMLRIRGLLAPALGLLLLLACPSAAGASDDVAALKAEKAWLAYVITHDGEVDSQSEAGLAGLRQILMNRTSVEPEGIAGVDPEQDELAFYPLLYWPVTAAQPDLSEVARARINRYLQHGGMILFDTRDGHDGNGANPDLIRLAAGLDLPPLAPNPPDHVLTRSFYILDGFPGTFRVNTLWLDANPERRNDSVSGLIVGGGNWAEAWSRSNGRSGQAEMARRFGVNLVMYALAGNYKSDQIHVKTLLERIGR